MAIRTGAGKSLNRAISGDLLKTSFTVIGRIQVKSVIPGDDNTIFGAQDQYLWAVDYPDDGNMYFGSFDGTNFSGGTFASRPGLDEWFTLYVRCSGSGANLLQFGWARDADASFVTGVCTVQGGTLSKMLFGTSSTPANGDIRLEGLKVWSVALTDPEIALERRQISPAKSANLFSYYPMDATKTTLALALVDQSGNGKDLSATGTPTIEAGSGLINGAGATTLVLAASATGIHSIKGTGAATLSLSASATGTFSSPTVTGAGATTLILSAAASGVRGVAGTGASTLTLAASATGVTGNVTGTGAATLALGASAVGKVGFKGTGVVAFSLIANATGSFATPVTGAGSSTLILLAAGQGSSGGEWTPISPTPETWTAQAASPESWTPIAQTPGSWT